MKNSQVMKLLKAKEKGFNKKMMENLFGHNGVAAWEAWLGEMTIENFNKMKELLSYKIYQLENDLINLNQEFNDQQKLFNSYFMVNDLVVGGAVILSMAEDVNQKLKVLQDLSIKILEKGKMLASLKELRNSK